MNSTLGRSPTVGLLIGLIITLAAVAAYSWYITRQISGLRALQTDLADRNRKDTLQLLRIQNDLNTVALAMRDILDNDEHYPVTAWSAQFDRIQADLTDALQREERVAVGGRPPEQQRYLGASLAQFWDATGRMFAVARQGRDADARLQIQLSLQSRQAALSTTVARLLVQNNESEDQTAQRVEAIYGQVARQVYGFLGVTLVAISLTSLYLIHANRRVYAELAMLSERRQDLAQRLITAREETLREISRELHDGLGQILTAMGSMLGRAAKHAPEGSPLRAELREIGEIAQTTLDNVRGLSQTLHPSILEEAGLDDTIAWYVSGASRQIGVEVSYERSGPAVDVAASIGIHVYRVLQEALSNVARHSGAQQAWVRLRLDARALQLEVEDRGRGLKAATARRGLGIVTMAERAELMAGTIDFLTPAGGGTLVRLRVPIGGPEHDGR
ncbi:MAG TPA: sensor histidine kinase [Vicinamibacterales bacterium]|jgi:signal transduction histidine kinase|nr:sensor histidine kinase [Vicinamibacterales bacterium]